LEQNKTTKPIREGQRNKNRIIKELLKSPLTFKALKEKVGLSSKTLSQHLTNLQNESLVKREIQDRYIVYVALNETFLEMRKALHDQLNELLWIYWDSLDKETMQLLNQVEEALKKSISQPEPKALNTKYLSKTIPIPRGNKNVVITQDLNLSEKRAH